MDAAVALCGGAYSTAPAICANDTPFSVPLDVKAGLCCELKTEQRFPRVHKASTLLSQCFTHAWRQAGVPHEMMIRVCRGFADGNADVNLDASMPAKCMVAIRNG